MRKLDIKTSIRNRYVLVGGAVIILAFLLYQLFGPPSPALIKKKALYALETGDAEALCRLASKEEVERLHLTPEKVSSFLRSTLWRNGYPKSAKLVKANTSDDFAIWIVDWQGENKDPKSGKVSIAVIDNRDKGWNLLLSNLLYDSCYWAHSQSGERFKYAELAQQQGIRGLLASDGKYHSMGLQNE